ncbi:MAG: TIM-barrel domain-containing protein [Candidatus Limnocylindrales bacterium]
MLAFSHAAFGSSRRGADGAVAAGGSLVADERSLTWSGPTSRLRVEVWGPHAVRVRATGGWPIPDRPGALLPLGPGPQVASEAVASVSRGQGVLVNGRLRVQLSTDGRLTFLDAGTRAPLLAEPPGRAVDRPARHFAARGDGLHRLTVSFESDLAERIYGLGQHPNGRLDQKGQLLDLFQRDAWVAIPFALSSRGYGFLWNNPAIGQVHLAAAETRWTAEATDVCDYWVVAGDTREILAAYADATGHPRPLPDWALGFWQSRLRYRTQAEVPEVAREYRERGLPLSVIAIDAWHWPLMGEWRFDPRFWPDPTTMVAELRGLGVETLVSIWPTVNPLSGTHAELLDRGELVMAKSGGPATTTFRDVDSPQFRPLAIYDATNSAARADVWARIERGYASIGIRAFWLDAAEPELVPPTHESLILAAGSGLEVGADTPTTTPRPSSTASGRQASRSSSCSRDRPGPGRNGSGQRCGPATSTRRGIR